MTIASTTSRMMYAGAGSAGPFPYNFRIFAATDLLVTKRSSAAAETTLVYGTDFTLTAGVSVGDATGSITLTTALAVGETLSIRRVPSLTQPTSLRNGGPYYGSIHEDEFDRLVMQVQELRDRVDRSFGVLESYDPSGLLLRVRGEAGKLLGWASATELTNLSVSTAGIAIPGEGRSGTPSGYLANNSVYNVKDYGATGDGATDDTVAIAAAKTAAQAAAKGAVLYFPRGEYVTGEVKITVDGLSIVGAGRGTTLIAKANNQTLLKISASNCRVQNLTLRAGNGVTTYTGVRGLAIVASDEAQTTLVVSQNFNLIEAVLIYDCITGVELKCGPTVAGSDSNCFYNTLIQVDCVNCNEAFKLANPITVPGAGPNATHFVSCRAGTLGGASNPNNYGNKGFYIAAGSECVLLACAAEGITLGGAPVGIRIDATSTGGPDNNNNTFLSFRAEACTADVLCNNSRAGFIMCFLNPGKMTGSAPFGRVNITGDPSFTPLLLPGLEYGEGIAGYSSGRWKLTKGVDVTTDLTTVNGERISEAVTAPIANGGTVDILIPNVRQPTMLIVYTGSNLLNGHVVLIFGDGAVAPSLTPLAAAGDVVITAPNATHIRITNNTGIASIFRYVFKALGTPLP